MPIEVTLLTSSPGATSSSTPVVPVQTETRPSAVSAGASAEQGRSLANRRGTDTTPQFPTAVAKDEDEKRVFSGHVINSDGIPVADAEILYPVRSNVLKSVTRTEVDGTFRFEFPRSEFKKGERVDISATHPDYASGWQKISPQGATGIALQLSMPAVISGKIMNEAGEPIQNAEARIQHVLSGSLMSSGGEERLVMDSIPLAPAKIDANEKFVLRELPEGAKVEFAIQAPGYAKETRSSVSVGMEGLEFRLKREGRIEGHLSYAKTGAPVKGATVALKGLHQTGVWEKASTDANGNYLLKNLAPGMYNLFLQKGQEGWTAVAKEFIKVVEGRTVSNIDLTLIRGGFITGRVADQDTNKPTANHHIGFYDAAGPESQPAIHGMQTDETGVYHFRATPGRAQVYTSAPSEYQDVGRIIRYVDVVEAETVIVDFQFLKGIELVGRILTEAGEPVTGAKITDVIAWYKEYGRSNEQGEFTVRGLRPGRKLVLKAEHSELKLRGTVEVEVQPGASVEIQMQQYERVKVSGRVVNRKGEPIPSVNIGLTPWPSHQSIEVMTIVDVTDGDGRFRELGLIVGDEYVISANAKGYQGAETEMFTVIAGMSQIAELVLLPAPGPFFIEGRITDTAGEPVRGARVYITEPQLWETRTDENGDYRFEELSTAIIGKISIDHSKYAYHVFKNLESDQRHDLVLVKADGYLIGKVVDTDGQPIEQAIVRIDIEGDDSSGYIYTSTRTNVLGEFEIKHIKDKVVPLYVSDGPNYKIKNIAVNQRDLVLMLPRTKPKPKD